MFIHLIDQGYSPVALYKDKKNPVLKNWQELSEKQASPELVQAWEKDFAKGNLNIGVVCGRASNLIAIDIDIDDEDLYNIVPPSPVRKRGGKGEVRFFRFCEDQRTAHFSDILGAGVLDILSTGSQTVLPPSVHPLTKKPYFWLTPDTLFDTKAEELPVFSNEWLPAFQAWLHDRNKKIEKKTGIKEVVAGAGGRNNKLKAIVTAMRGRGCDEREVIEEIYNYDRSKFSPRLFSDPSENKKYQTEDDAYNNAARFYSSVNNSLISNGVIRYEQNTQDPIIDFDSSDIEQAKQEAFKPKPYPMPRGIMKLFVDLCELKSAGKQDATGLGGAIALMSAITSNRFVTECRGLTTCPNTYIINLGYSSFGKEMAQSILIDLLFDSGILGSGNYKSAVSVIMNLPKQQERLDVIDECSSILSAMGSKDGYASQIVELLSEIFTKGSTRYQGQTSLTNGDRFGACYNPHVSIIGSTTPKGFRSSVNKEVAAKGLLPRMLLFFQHELGSYKGRQDRARIEEIYDQLSAFVENTLSKEKVIHPDFDATPNIISPKQDKKGTDVTLGYRYKQVVVPFTPEAHEAWLNYEEECHNAKCVDPDGFESAFIGRFSELTAKLALLDAISLGRSKIELDSFQWARDVVETQWHNAKPLYEVAHAESKTESDVLRVLSIIKKAGIIDRSSLVRKTQWLEKRMFDQAINSLIESVQIQAIIVGTGVKKKTFYKPI